MKKIRTLPYGYMIRNGIRVVNEAEADIVRYIFSAYLDGASLSEIAAMLTTRQIPYNENRAAWNKNHVARIISNPRYTGADDFQVIIDPDIFKEANFSKFQRTIHTAPSNNGGNEKIRAMMLCGKCSSKTVRFYDQRNRIPVSWLCNCSDCRTRVRLADDTLEKKITDLMNQVIRNPHLLDHEEAYRMAEEAAQRSKITSELRWMCDSGHYSDEQLIRIILENAQNQYSQCPENQSRMVSMISRAYSEATPSEIMNTELLLKTVSNILLYPDGSITLRLINGNEITEGESM